MIDLHCHLLPDWDDGPESWEETENMVEIAISDGIKKVCITPHFFRFSRYNDDLEVLRDRINAFNERFKKENRLKFYWGAEIFVHPDIIAEVKSKNLSVNGSDYVFVEFPSDQVPAGARELFYQMMLSGYTPIISHPERNNIICSHPELLYDLVNRGCLAQVTAMSLTGEFGSEIQKKAELFLKNNLVHLIASDAHDSKRRKPVLSKAVEVAGKIVSQEKAKALVEEIPQAILNNEVIPDWGNPVNPKMNKKFFDFIKERFFKKNS
jgi:protein-tyrosine phosphatase